MKIYKGKYGWSALCINEFNGKVSKCYLSLAFKKGTEPAGEEGNINVSNFMLSAYEGKTGVQPKMIVLDYTFVAPKLEKTEDDNNSNFGGETQINNDLVEPDDLPFY